jgi:hypothetical protein
MPTNATAYNSRVTDEALEKRFRDTFTSQGGSELVSDLYAQGVIVPIVDFTAAATGDVLGQNLQTAWDFSTGSFSREDSSEEIINTTGFWQVDVSVTGESSTANRYGRLYLTDGVSLPVNVYYFELAQAASAGAVAADRDSLVIFVNSGQSVYAQSSAQDIRISGVYRQIADISGNLTNPLGFTSS